MPMFLAFRHDCWRHVQSFTDKARSRLWMRAEGSKKGVSWISLTRRLHPSTLPRLSGISLFSFWAFLFVFFAIALSLLFSPIPSNFSSSILFFSSPFFKKNGLFPSLTFCFSSFLCSLTTFCCASFLSSACFRLSIRFSAVCNFSFSSGGSLGARSADLSCAISDAL